MLKISAPIGTFRHNVSDIPLERNTSFQWNMSFQWNGRSIVKWTVIKQLKLGVPTSQFLHFDKVSLKSSYIWTRLLNQTIAKQLNQAPSVTVRPKFKAHLSPKIQTPMIMPLWRRQRHHKGICWWGLWSRTTIYCLRP